MEKHLSKPRHEAYLDKALDVLSDAERQEYEEAIELWITYGGD